jgi:hypothetical protein
MSIGYRAKITWRRVENGVAGASPSRVWLLELTVPHKTVAEPY